MANNFQKLLGESLKGKTGSATTESLSQNDVVGLYFSAHWCPPCRGFTPKLAEIYNELRGKGKKFEIVFVSSDRDEAAFDEYFQTMPWLALPYEERKTKAKLSSKYGVSGIPTLVLLNSNGEVITKDGRTAVMTDKDGFPWPQPTLEEMLGDRFLSGDGDKGKEAVAGKILGLYFSASWCPPCRAFSPTLSECYRKLRETRQDFEFIFISSDQSESDFKEYFAKMPFLALPFDNPKKDALSSFFEVEGIPTFVVVGADGNIITADARSAVTQDPEGKEFPWHPKPVNNVDNPSGINDKPALVILAEAESKSTQEQYQNALSVVAAEAIAKAKAEGEDPALFFMGTNEGGIADRLRELTGVGKARIAGGEAKKETVCEGDVCRVVQTGGEQPNTKVVLLDIPDQGGFYEFSGEKIDADSLRAFLAGYSAGSLTRKQLQK